MTPHKKRKRDDHVTTGERHAYGRRCPDHGIMLDLIQTGLYFCPACHAEKGSGYLVDKYGTLLLFNATVRKSGEQIYGGSVHALGGDRGRDESARAARPLPGR